MKFKLVGFFLLLVLLAVGVVYYLRNSETPRVEPSLPSLISTIPLEEPDVPNPPPSEEDLSAMAPSRIQWEEYGNRQFRLSGILPSGRLSERLQRAVEAKLMKEELLENRIQILLNAQEALWFDAALALDYGKFLNVRDIGVSFTAGNLKVSGRVQSEQEKKRITDYVSSVAKSAALAPEVELQVGDFTSPILSIWQGPDRTVLVQGELAEGARVETVAMIKKNLPAGARLVEDIRESRFVKTPSWMERLEDVLPPLLREVQDLHFAVERTRVEVSGLALRTSIERLRSIVTKHFPEPTYEVSSKILLGTPKAMPTEDNPNQPTRYATVDDWVRNNKIYFGSSRATRASLTPEEESKLSQLATLWLSENHQAKLHIFGFTDSSGEAEVNEYIRKERGQVVANYLANAGIDRQLLVVRETPPEVLAAAEANAKNARDLRRAEFRIEGDDIAVELAPTITVPPLERVRFEDVVTETKIYFDVSSYSLGDEDKQKLERLAAAMLAEDIRKPLAIYGYADSRGSAEANQWITEERTKAVRDFLISREIPGDLLQARPVRTAKVIEEEGEQKIDLEARKQADRDARRVEFGLVEDEVKESPESAEGAPNAGEVETNPSEGQESDPAQGETESEASEGEGEPAESGEDEADGAESRENGGVRSGANDQFLPLSDSEP